MEEFQQKNSVLVRLVAVLAVIFVAITPVYAQINTPCTISMISSFTPCMNFITGSSSNGSSPTSDCCGTLRSVMGRSMDCACLIITASVPFQLPINRTLAISLPRACNLGGVPVQCKASGVPLPAPAPVAIGGQAPAPAPFSSSTPKASTVPESESPAIAAPESPETTTLPPSAASPPVDLQTPATFPGRRPVVTPSSSVNLYRHFLASSPLALLFGLGIIMVLFKFY